MTIKLSDRKTRVSEILLDIGAVHFSVERPFMFTSGWASPVYVNCRKVVSATWQRREIVQLIAGEIERNIGQDHFDIIAGGETAGIPYAAWVSEYFYRPMIYVRKKTKEFGLGKQIEGDLEPGQRVLLIEDLMTDGMSKVQFVQALKDAGALVDSAVVVFNYGVYPGTEEHLRGAGLTVYALTDWYTTLDVAEARGGFSAEQSARIREFLKNPSAWSKAHGGTEG